ncbi:MAG: hypothetical protein NZS48_02655 [Gemmata sp.]|nr:hypothetical protein [Gemmata sp.]
MSTSNPLESLLQAVEPALRLVHERHLRQIVYYLQDRGQPLPTNTELPFWFPRSDLIAADVLPAHILHGPEERLLLVTNPDDRLIDDQPLAVQLQVYWRLLFRAGIMKVLDDKWAKGTLNETTCSEKMRRLGAAATREIRFVLESDHLIARNATNYDCYRMFAAIFFDLAYFLPAGVREYFPSLPDWNTVRAILADDIDAEQIYRSVRPEGASEVTPPIQSPDVITISVGGYGQSAVTADTLARMQKQATDAAQRGNDVRAAILRMQVAMATTGFEREQFLNLALADLQRLVQRLAQFYQWNSATTERWQQALRPLLPLAASGNWPRAARCLYELQRIPADFSREVYTVDLPEYLRSFGRRPIRRKLPLARPVMVLMTLRKAYQQLLRSGLNESEQHRLAQLLHHEIHRQEAAIRQEFQPIVTATLSRCGLIPQNRVEAIARDKVVAELLDRVCERGYLRIADLRDAIARNQLKLPDLRGPWEFLRGDALLRTDAELAETLDGVYRRGECYLRWLQRFVSVFFGTPWGRILTLYLALPFGGSFLTLMFAEELRHIGLSIGEFVARSMGGRSPQPVATPAPLHTDTEHAPEPANTPQPPEDIHFDEEELVFVWSEDMGQPAFDPVEGVFVWIDEKAREQVVRHVQDFFTSTARQDPESHHHHASLLVAWETIVAFGFFLLLMIHVPAFRHGVYSCARTLWHIASKLFWQWPIAVWHSPPVKRIRQSRWVRFIDRHLSVPFLMSLLVLAIAFLVGVKLSVLLWFGWLVFVALVVFYNTPTGWEIQDRIAEAISDWWRVVRVNLIPGLIATFLDLFRSLANWIERQLYAVDEWMRFRGGDSQKAIWLKAILGLLWFPIAYLTRFVFYLLVEPQVNPVKHFPVVTVSHKVIWPMVPQLAQWTGISPWTMGMIINGIPGIFGFIAWELKENWRLYAANRSASLPRVMVGSHGESMRGLLRPGFHSGTVPKLRRKIRQSLQSNQRAKLVHLHHDLEHIAVGVERLAQRELLPLLLTSPTWGELPVAVESVHLGVQRAEIALKTDPPTQGPFTIAIENREGILDAEIASFGWVGQLSESQQQMLIFALRGFLDMAAVMRFQEHERTFDEPKQLGWADLRRRVSWKEWINTWG